MRLPKHPDTHLTYCMNIHPGESWGEQLAAINSHALSVHQNVSPDESFGLGLWVSAKGIQELQSPSRRAEFKALLERENLYTFTLNGFPYGSFHGERIKEGVYRPDWRTGERLEYTIALAEFLADVLPEGVNGSISTVPGSYKEWIREADDREAMMKNLRAVAATLERIKVEKGKTIRLGLEPEPDCYLETSEEAAAFCVELGAPSVGVCFDTCHHALQFEDLEACLMRYGASEVPIVKTQISAALEVPNTVAGRGALARFIEPVYLHQVRLQQSDKSIQRWPDLSDMRDLSDGGRLRVHYHVPLDWLGEENLRSTSGLLTPSFWKSLEQSGCPHWEVETYTFDVLPTGLKQRTISEQIEKEFRWVLDRVNN